MPATHAHQSQRAPLRCLIEHLRIGPWRHGERAKNARHPPKCVMSSLPSSAAGSHRKPLTRAPSSSYTVPITMGAGTSATNEPNASVVSDHTSSSMPPPVWPGVRTRPGFGGVVFASAKSR